MFQKLTLILTLTVSLFSIATKAKDGMLVESNVKSIKDGTIHLVTQSHVLEVKKSALNSDVQKDLQMNVGKKQRIRFLLPLDSIISMKSVAKVIYDANDPNQTSR